ncbi:tripartite tricarboxylate transporter substrate binding protein [uncultured Azohydromonas sp.]|jgi:Uncharacterized protein conserved in bacteria|uniref:Bug family tripartite tricarboxylate transporter substrate binding protein n=1 Tax=uncultured Azohydromonas sp. TaxID=487342 RepID=UPI00262575F1|nr:tripartite tricarboxylate transporter substrate binding protein [uncultured Azohydromonas sp.]
MNRKSQHESRVKYWIGALAAAMALPGAAQADAWPRRPVTIVVGFAAGAGTDMLARAVADKLTGRLGQPVVVENKAGAGGSFAVSAVAAAPADGHTLLLAPNTVVISPHLMKTRTDILTDLVPVGQVTRSTLLLATSPTAGLGVKDVKELTALARKQPGLSFGTAGMGTPQHIAGELYKKSAGIELTHIAYRGTAPALTDLIGGQINLSFTSLTAAKPYLDSGRLVPLAVVEKDRSPLLPNVPTMTEQGVPGVELTGWFGTFAPKGTPAEVVAKINKEIAAVLALPDIQKRFKDQGELPMAGTPEAFGELVRSEYRLYEKIVRDFGIKVD